MQESYTALTFVLKLLRANFESIGGSLELIKFKTSRVDNGASALHQNDATLSFSKDKLRPIVIDFENSVTLLPADNVGGSTSPSVIAAMSIVDNDEGKNDITLYEREADLTFTEDDNKLETSIDDLVLQSSSAMTDTDGREFTTLDSETFARVLSLSVNEQIESAGAVGATGSADLPGPRRDVNSASRNNRAISAPGVSAIVTGESNDHEREYDNECENRFQEAVDTDALESSADFDVDVTLDTSFTRSAVCCYLIIRKTITYFC